MVNSLLYCIPMYVKRKDHSRTNVFVEMTQYFINYKQLYFNIFPSGIPDTKKGWLTKNNI